MIDLTDLPTIKQVLTYYNVSAQKKLGQHFLIDKEALNMILDAGDLSSKDFVVEVGPGFGGLTFPMVERAGMVMAIETDPKILEILQVLGSGVANLAVRQGNILRLRTDDVEKEFRQWLSMHPKANKKYKLVANLPYYITSAILKMFLEGDYKPSLMVVMIQKEVAERITAGPGEMSVLAVSVQYYGVPEIVHQVTRKSFWPQPQVDSAVLKITPYDKNPWGVKDIKLFFRIVKSGFGEKRKQLHNSLTGGLQLSNEEVRQVLEKVGIDPKTRAQDLEMRHWVDLYNEFSQILT